MLTAIIIFAAATIVLSLFNGFILARYARYFYKNNAVVPVSYRWYAGILPVIVFIVSAIMVFNRYSELSDTVAVNFKLDGTPTGFLSSEGAIVALLGIQFILMLSGMFIPAFLAKIGAHRALLKNPVSLLVFNGNIVGLPGIAIIFVMLDIFVYNFNEIHLMTMWVFVLIIVALAILTFSFEFFYFIFVARQLLLSQNRQEVNQKKDGGTDAR